MLIPFSMFLVDSDEGKIKYTALYGRGNKVTIWVGRHFQSGMLPIERASKKTYLGHMLEVGLWQVSLENCRSAY